MTDKHFAAVGNRLPVDQMEQTAQAVAAARGHHHRLFLAQCPLHRCQPLGVGTCKTLVHGQRRAVYRAAKAQCLESFTCQIDACRIGDGA